MSGGTPEPVRHETRPWYADGLRFTCTQCGNCCTGPPGAVWFTEDEGRAIARRLGIGFDRFIDMYTRRVGTRRSFNERETEHGYDCVFLDRDTVPGKAVCGIYEDRPGQCRTWPFWQENVRSRRDWAAAADETPCPGMDRGTLVTVEEIVKRLNGGGG